MKDTIQEILATHATFQGCFNWGSNGNARSRRPEIDTQVELHWQGALIEISQTMHQSRANTYYKLAVYVDGVKKDVRALKKLVSEIGE